MRVSESGLETGLEAGARDEASDHLVSEAAFQAFYRSTSRSLWAYLYRVLGDAAHAEDIMQDAFLRFLRAPVAALDPSAQRAWIFRVAANLAIDQLRRRGREDRAVAQAGQETAATTAAAGSHLDVGRSFAQLKPRERALLWLAYVEGSEHREIARALELKPSSVKVLLFRARRKMMALLTRNQGDPRKQGNQGDPRKQGNQGNQEDPGNRETSGGRS